jgi:hypothetical protein
VPVPVQCWAAVTVTVPVTHWGAYEALVFGQEHGNAGVDLADCEGDEHGACERVCVVLGRRDLFLLVWLELVSQLLPCMGGPTINRASHHLHHSPSGIHVVLTSPHHRLTHVRMPRSARQRATRSWKRLQTPTFPFTRLPDELQLMVLANRATWCLHS